MLKSSQRFWAWHISAYRSPIGIYGEPYAEICYRCRNNIGDRIIVTFNLSLFGVVVSGDPGPTTKLPSSLSLILSQYLSTPKVSIAQEDRQLPKEEFVLV